MKITQKNTVFCFDAQRTKMFFSNEKAATNYIKFNSAEIIDEDGNSPNRHYYCICCGGWHITSQENRPNRKSKTELMLLDIEQKKDKNKFEEEKNIASLDLLENKIKQLENIADACNEFRANILERLFAKFHLYNQHCQDQFKERMTELAIKLSELSVNIKGIPFFSDYTKKMTLQEAQIIVQNLLLRIESLQTNCFTNNKDFNRRSLKNIKADFFKIEDNKFESEWICEQKVLIKDQISQLNYTIRQAAKGADKTKKVLEERDIIENRISELFNKIESSITLLQTSNTSHAIGRIAYIYDTFFALNDQIKLYKKNLKFDHHRGDVDRKEQLLLERKIKLEDQLDEIIKSMKLI